MQSIRRGFMAFLIGSAKHWESIWNREAGASANSTQVNEVATVRGNPAQQLNVGETEVENCDFNLKATITGVTSGQVKGTYEVNLPNLPQAGIAEVQNKVLVQGVAGALGAMATDYANAAAPADPAPAAS